MSKSWSELKRSQRSYILRLLNSTSMELPSESKDEKEAIVAALQVLADATTFPVSKS